MSRPKYVLTIEYATLHSCYGPRKLARVFAGRKYLTVQQIDALKIPRIDKLWAILRIMPNDFFEIFLKQHNFNLVSSWETYNSSNAFYIILDHDNHGRLL